MLRFATALFLMLLLASPAAAQLAKGETAFGIFAGLSMPMGDFGDDSGDDAGGATTGFAVGGTLDYALTATGLLWTSNVSLMRNGFDDDVLGFPNDVDVDAGSWMVIPVLTGLKYQGNASPTLGIYGEGMLGLAFVMPPDADLTQGEAEGSIETDSAMSFGFAFGGGVVINDQITAGVRFLLLGKPEYDTAFDNGQEVQEGESETSIQTLLIHAGLRF